MSATGLRQFDRTLQTTNEWLNDVMAELHTDDRNKAYLAFRATIQTLRDRLTVDEAVHLGAQLPMLVRGFYYEGWKPSATPTQEEEQQEFLELIADYFPLDADLGPQQAARVTFTVLQNHVTEGEINNIKAMLPPELRSLWPEPAEKAE